MYEKKSELFMRLFNATEIDYQRKENGCIDSNFVLKHKGTSLKAYYNEATASCDMYFAINRSAYSTFGRKHWQEAKNYRQEEGYLKLDPFAGEELAAVKELIQFADSNVNASQAHTVESTTPYESTIPIKRDDKFAKPSLQKAPLGFNSAIGALNHGRAGFFGSANGDLPQNRKSPEIKKHDLIPQFGYVGNRYSSRRVLFLGINPGNGNDESPSAADAQMMPVLEIFMKEKTPDSFRAAQSSYQIQCETWPIWKRHCSEVLGAGGLSMDEIAYSNCLPWRTNSQSKFDDFVGRNAAVLYAYPLIEELQPTIVVALGKKVEHILSLAHRSIDSELIVWNRAQAATKSVIEDRANSAKQLFSILDFRRP